MILLLSDCSWRKGGKDSIESCENLFCAVGPRCAPITWGSTFQAPRGHSIAAVPICADLIDGNEEHQMPTTRDSSSAAPSCQLHQKGRLDQEARGHSPCRRLYSSLCNASQRLAQTTSIADIFLRWLYLGSFVLLNSGRCHLTAHLLLE